MMKGEMLLGRDSLAPSCRVHHGSFLSGVARKPSPRLKKNETWRMCIEYTDLNKAFPKDPFALLGIEQIIDSTVGCQLLCFLDAYSGYHQIKMALEDQEKTSFITPYGIYCYTSMPFGLKNAGATYQRMVQNFLKEKIGHNVDAYVDGIVIKS